MTQTGACIDLPPIGEQARRRAEAFPNVTFVEGDATKLPFEPGSFDLACSIRTLHHIARPELAGLISRWHEPG